MQDNTNDECGDDSNSTDNPTIAGVAKWLAQCNGKLLDEKQYITYDIVCCTFLLQLLNKALDSTSSVHTKICLAISKDDNSEMIDGIKEQLLHGGNGSTTSLSYRPCRSRQDYCSQGC
jgi:hypothetical protein